MQYVYVTKEKEGRCRYPKGDRMVAQMSCVHSLIALSLFFFFNKLLVIGISVSHISDSLFASEE